MSFVQLEIKDKHVLQLLKTYQKMGLVGQIKEIESIEDIEEKKKREGIKAAATEIINYLNKKRNKRFKITDKTVKIIGARLSEGFEMNDFKKVIDVKSINWDNPRMEQYIRPETLFGTKMNNYINEVPIKSRAYGVNRVDEDDLLF